jgi:primosomal protein N' (replication factor Y)
VEQTLKREFPDVSIVRIDRDTVSRKGSMETKLAEIRGGHHRILIGTQMLSKGHDFPDITLVGILNVDQGLFSTDFRAMERMAQLIVQVSGRAGRADKPGKVLLQTHQPDHPLLRTLLTGGYGAFCAATLRERRLAELPPYRYMAMLRAEATNQTAPAAFLDSVRADSSFKPVEGIAVMGPVPAPMERRAGRYRAQLLIIARHRKQLRDLFKQISGVLHQSRASRRVRWSLDVDPVDLS